MTIRSVALPADVEGQLYLSAMPGRSRSLDEDMAGWAEHGVELIVCLTEAAEIHTKSPDYAAAIEAGAIGAQRLVYPIQDFDVPGERQHYLGLVQDLAERLRTGQRLLVHCAGGIGRTGMTAVAVLCCLGLPLDEAERRVWAAGSRPENRAQKEMVRWLAARMSNGETG